MRRPATLALIAGLLAACQSADPAPPVVAAAPAVAAPHAPVTVVERSRQDANRDDVIQSLVARKLREIDRAAYRGVTVEAWSGSVLLMGAVIKPEQRRRAEQTAAATPGVTGVVNELILAEDKALDLFIPNIAKEEQLRRALGIEGKAGLIVRVVNNVAFLFGGVADRAQARALKEDAGEVDGIKWVVAHLQDGK